MKKIEEFEKLKRNQEQKMPYLQKDKSSDKSTSGEKVPALEKEKSSDKKTKLKSKSHNSTDTVAVSECDAHSPVIMFKRWKKIEEDFLVKKKDNKHVSSPTSKHDKIFDISKLPEIADNIKYDIIHYPELRDCTKRRKLLKLAMQMARVCVPFEYGITKQ